MPARRVIQVAHRTMYGPVLKSPTARTIVFAAPLWYGPLARLGDTLVLANGRCWSRKFMVCEEAKSETVKDSEK